MNENQTLYKLINYMREEPIMTNISIYEYDISKANINILYAYGLIPKYNYDALYNSDKHYREVIIGKMIAEDSTRTTRTNKIGYRECIGNGIIKAKQILMETNHIIDDQVIRIANDSMYINSRYPLNHIIFPICNSNHNIEFKCKNHFTSYVQFSNKVIVFFSIAPDDKFNVEVKGISDELYSTNSFLLLICELLFYKERTDNNMVMKKYNEIYNRYINKEYDWTYYKEFNPRCAVRLLKNPNNGRVIEYGITNDQVTLSDIDINYNLTLLRELYSYLLM